MGRWITASEYLKGQLDEVRIYNRALKADEIKMAMNTAITAPNTVPAVAMTSTISDQRRKAFEVDPDPDTSSETDPVSQPTTQPGSQPVVDIRMSRQAYDPGDTVTASACWISNPSPQNQVVELKTWVAVPGLYPIPVESEELKGTLTMPAGLDKDYGSLPLFEVTGDLPAGTCYLNARMVNPVTGDLLAEDINSFTIGTISRISGRGTPGVPSVWQDPASWVEGDFTWSIDDDLQLSGQYAIANRSAAPATIEIKVWLEAPGQNPVPVFSIGADGSLGLAEGATITLNPMASSQAAENLPAGTWRLVARVLDWVTGQVLSQTMQDFELR